MGIKFKKPSSNNNPKEFVPQGNHLARIFKIVEVGTKDYEWQGEAKTKRALRVYYELPNQMRVFNEDKGEQRRTSFFCGCMLLNLIFNSH